MIIVEGTDLVGKTTLCKKICKYLNEKVDKLPEYYTAPYKQECNLFWRYTHLSAQNSGWDYHWGYVSHMHPRNVQDRFHLSEMAYRHAIDKPHRIVPAELQALQGKLLTIGCMTIVITADVELLQQRYAEAKREEMFSIDTILKANEFFCRGDLGQEIAYPCDSFVPFVPDEKIEQWCNTYLDRQIDLAQMNARKH